MRGILSLLLSLILLFGVVSPVLATSSSLEEIPPTYEKVAENGTFQLYVNPETLAFKVVDKRDGYLWHSNLDEKLPGDRLNKSWTAFAQSGFSIDYLDPMANSSRASITNAEHHIEIHPIENGIQAQVTFTEAAISVVIRLLLEESGLRVEVPFEGIQENGKYRLGWLHLYPWMGATRRAEIDGYMFLPDGSGSLIRFTEQTRAQNMYYGRYYGPDLGMLASLPKEPTLRRPYPLSLPVIGMVHEQDKRGEKIFHHPHAYLLIIEQGAAYAEIRAHPAGIITNFNFLYNAFLYNESYFHRTSRAGEGVTVLQPYTNHYDVVLHYRFLSGQEANYVGMARSYRQYLLEKGLLRPVSLDPNTAIGVRLEFLAAEQEKILFWNRTIPMTSLSQMKTILQALQVENPQVVYYGWQPGGASAPFPLQLRLDRKIGTPAQLEALARELAKRGGTLNLYFDPLAALTYAPMSFSRYELAMAITNTYLTGSLRGKPNYYFNLHAVERRFLGLSNYSSQYLPIGLALDHIGSMLYSDFRRERPLNREETLTAYQALFAKSEVPLAFYTPNAYLFQYVGAYYDIPLSNSSYTYADESVPFLPIVLSGVIPYYGEALNFSPHVRLDLLRHAEYGAYPSFFVTYEETARILKTRSNWIYVSAYQQLEEEIESSYAWLNTLLQPVRGAAIVDHQQLAPQVFATTYSNGFQVIVNYAEYPVTVNGLTIPAQDAVLHEVRP